MLAALVEALKKKKARGGRPKNLFKIYVLIVVFL